MAMAQQIDTDSYTVREAAAACGVSVDTIRRRLTDGRFPNAEQRRGRTGDEWQIPGADLGLVAAAEGWSLSIASAEPRLDEGFVERYEAAIVAAAKAEAQHSHLAGQLEQAIRERDRARSDLEHEQSELRRSQNDLTEAAQRAAVAQARTEEIRGELERTAERFTELRTEFDELRDAHIDMEVAHAEALTKVDQLSASMGWWTRRRYEKRQRSNRKPAR